MLCTGLYRRGAMYWWRRQLRFGAGPHFTVAISLGTRDPRIARLVADCVSVRSSEMISGALQSREGVAAALARYAALQRHDHAERLARDIADLARPGDVPVHASKQLREAIEADRQSERAEKFDFRIKNYRIYGALDRIAAEGGPDAVYDDELENRLAGEGYSPFERDKIRHRLGHGYAREAYRPGSAVAGTPPREFVEAIQRTRGLGDSCSRDPGIYAHFAIGRARANENAAAAYREAATNFKKVAAANVIPLPVARIFNGIQWPAPAYSCADALERGEFDVVSYGSATLVPLNADQPAVLPLHSLHAMRQAWPQGPAGLDIRKVVSQEASSRTADDIAGQPDLVRLTSLPDVVMAGPVSLVRSEAVDVARDASPGSDVLADVRTMGELLARVIRAKEHAGEWDTKTSKQVTACAALFVQVVGSDHLADIAPRHFAKFRDVLDLLPKTHGKSSRDAALTLAAVLKRGTALPVNAVGLKPPTINRYFNQLGSLMSAACARGFPLCDPSKFSGFRARDPRSPQQKKARFTIEDIAKLLRHKTWTNPNSGVAPSLYWVVLLEIYSGARQAELCGLAIADVDIEKTVILIRENEFRRLKNTAAERRLPLHPELIRLGFLDFVGRAKNADGLLFADLRERGENTPLADLFAKQFKIVLDEVLPTAQSELKSFHSFRSFVNTTLVNEKATDALRESIMGHSASTVNRKHYEKNIDDEPLRDVVKMLPLLSSHLKPCRRQ